MLEEASCSSSDEGSEEDEIGKGGSKGVEREGRREGRGGKRKDKEEIGEVVRGGSVREEVSEGVREVRGEEGDKNRSALHKRVKKDNGKE